MIRRVQELHAVLHQDRIVFDRDAQLLAAPLLERRVREVLEREHLADAARTCSGAAARSSATAHAVPRVADRVKPVGDVGPVVAFGRLNSITP
jgi:hypothetical protein